MSDSKIVEQASGWYARLISPDCSDGDRAAFAEWLRDPAHARAYEAARSLAESLPDLAAASPRLAAMAEDALKLTSGDASPTAAPRPPMKVGGC